MRRAILSALAPVARVLTRGRGRIAMFHRFARGDAFRRLSVERFEQRIEHLRRHYTIISLRELVRRLSCREPMRGCVAITFDDGYRDFLELAYPVLLKHRIPATIYLVSNFVDRAMWLWPDAIHWMCTHAAEGRYAFEFSHKRIDSTLGDVPSRNGLWETLADECLVLDSRQRAVALEHIQRELAVRLPLLPTCEYASMGWADIRGLDADLIDVGAHTCTHPILARCTYDEQRAEIGLCRTKLEHELQRPIEAFCYPNGRVCDFNSETIDILRACGFTSAVMSEGGLVSSCSEPLLLPRISAGDRHEDFLASVEGMVRSAVLPNVRLRIP